jgi:hypothetical protein
MAQMTIAEHGGSLRTFNGKQAHENGWLPLSKGQRMMHYEGSAQESYLLRTECDPDVEFAISESRTLRATHPIAFEYTNDVEERMTNGRTLITEIKSDERQLQDPDYAMKLEIVEEIYRRIDIDFQIVLAEDIFENRHHRENVELFSSRRFVHIDRIHIRRLEAHAMKTGGQSTYGDIAEALVPGNRVQGKALVQGLLIRRRVTIDLTQLIHDGTQAMIV